MAKAKFGRIDTIDLIRGYFLFVILVDHFGRNFSGYDLFTGGGVQWVSAAEGFFFVSGLMIGLVRARKLADQPLRVSIKKVWTRALQLYLWSVGLTVLFTLVAQFFIDNPGLKPGAFYNEPFWHFVTHTLMLRYNYGWADFLPYYAIYLFFTPIALWLLRAKKWYLLLTVNFIVWVAADNVQLAWQLLFFSGSIAGYYLPEIEAWFKSLKPNIKRIIYIVFTTIGTTTIAASMFFNTIIDYFNKPGSINPFGSFTTRLYDFNTYFLASYFDKYQLGYGRILLFFIWFIMLYLLVRYYENPIKKLLGWFLIPLGQNSLYVYITHALVLLPLNFYLPLILPKWVNFITTTLYIFTIWLLVKKKFLFKYIPR